MISLEEAQEKILAAVIPLPSQSCELPKALGRYLAAPVHSPIDLPSADNSAMDGYAVRAADLVNTTLEKPTVLSLAGEAAAGSTNDAPLKPGECLRIFTGAILPPGADAVVMQEDVTIAVQSPSKVTFTEPVKPWENVRLRGEDLREKVLIAEAGELLTPQLLSVLAATGRSNVLVGRCPLVGLLATGDELCEGTGPLSPSMIYESNRAGVSALAQGVGIAPTWYPLVPDDLAVIKRALKGALDLCEVVITTGGASVGDKDYVRTAFGELGMKLDFWKVSIRPGKPFAFGHCRGQLVFVLPGNPVSALVTFFLLVRPALLRLQGAKDVAPPKSWGTLAEPLANSGDRRHFIRVILDSEGRIRSAGGQGSHFMSSLARSTGLVDLPPKTTWPAGTPAAVLRWT